MTQLAFGAPSNSTPTSRAAAEAVLPRLSAQEARVIAYLMRGPAIQHEISAALHLPLSSINGRCNTLEKRGLVRKTGKTRTSPYGAQAAVYELVP